MCQIEGFHRQALYLYLHYSQIITKPVAECFTITFFILLCARPFQRN